jgi:hypothetical protein
VPARKKNLKKKSHHLKRILIKKLEIFSNHFLSMMSLKKSFDNIKKISNIQYYSMSGNISSITGDSNRYIRKIKFEKFSITKNKIASKYQILNAI